MKPRSHPSIHSSVCPRRPPWSSPNASCQPSSRNLLCVYGSHIPSVPFLLIFTLLNSSQGTRRQASESVLSLVCVPLFSGRSQRDTNGTSTQPQGGDCPLLALKMEGPRGEELRAVPGQQPVGKGAPRRDDSCKGPNLANNLNRLGSQQLLPQSADQSPESLCPWFQPGETLNRNPAEPTHRVVI